MFAAFGGFLYYTDSTPTPAGTYLWSWGFNTNGTLGQNDTISRSSPTQLGADVWNFISARETNQFGIGIKSNGTLWTWGQNTQGQLAQNDRVNRSSPTQVGALTTWSQVVAGDSSGADSNFAAIRTDGTLWMVGGNSYGQLAQSDKVSRSSPIQVGTQQVWSSSSIGNGSVGAITRNGILWTWGGNSTGNLGQNNVINRSSPVQVTLGPTSWSSISMGNNFSVGASTTGAIYAFGTGVNGQMGDNTSGIYRSAPIQVGALTGWGSVSGGGDFTMAVQASSGTLYTWGVNNVGQLGLGDKVYRSSPTQIGVLTTWSQAASGTQVILSTRNNGTMWGWGLNFGGALGLNDSSYRSSPTQIGAGTNWSKLAPGGYYSFATTTATLAVPDAPTSVTATAVPATLPNVNSTSATINWTPPVNDGGAYVTSYTVSSSPATTNQPVYGSTTQMVFTGLTAGTTYTFTVTANNSIGSSAASSASNQMRLPSSSAMWATGTGTFLGNNTSNAASNRSSPVQVPSAVNWAFVYGTGTPTGYVHAVNYDGTHWTWGFQASGAQGVGDLVSRSSPIQVGVLTNWSTRPGTMAGGNGLQFFIKSDGTLWTVGVTNQGAGLSAAVSTYRSSPVQVGVLTNWAQIAASPYAATAIKTDGTLWGWGANAAGTVGDGTVILRSSPVQIGGGTTWRKCWVMAGQGGSQQAAAGAIKSDGTAWVWGGLGANQGLNIAPSRSSPVQLGLLTNWAQIECFFAATAAIKTDGTLWSWGNNGFGQLGQNTPGTAQLSSPTQVGALTTWLRLPSANYNCSGPTAIRTDGTLWAWGNNNSVGTIGDGTIIARSSPVQVASTNTTNWVLSSAVGQQNMYAIQRTWTTPDPPTNVSAVSSSTGTATITFTEPIFSGGPSITVYTATSNPGGFTGTTTPAACFPNNSGTITVTGLTPGTAYNFTITGTNSLGTGVPSAPSLWIRSL